MILETLGDYAPRSKDPILLTEYVRHRLARQICTRYRNAEGELYVVALDPALEDRIRAGFEHNERGLFIRMSPQAVEATCRAISHQIERLTTTNHTPIVLVSPQIRAAAQANHRESLADAGGAELQRNHARHEDRDHRHRERQCVTGDENRLQTKHKKQLTTKTKKLIKKKIQNKPKTVPNETPPDENHQTRAKTKKRKAA